MQSTTNQQQTKLANNYSIPFENQSKTLFSFGKPNENINSINIPSTSQFSFKSDSIKNNFNVQSQKKPTSFKNNLEYLTKSEYVSPFIEYSMLGKKRKQKTSEELEIEKIEREKQEIKKMMQKNMKMYNRSRNFIPMTIAPSPLTIIKPFNLSTNHATKYIKERQASTPFETQQLNQKIKNKIEKKLETFQSKNTFNKLKCNSYLDTYVPKQQNKTIDLNENNEQSSIQNLRTPKIFKQIKELEDKEKEILTKKLFNNEVKNAETNIEKNEEKNEEQKDEKIISPKTPKEEQKTIENYKTPEKEELMQENLYQKMTKQLGTMSKLSLCSQIEKYTEICQKVLEQQTPNKITPPQEKANENKKKKAKKSKK